MAHHQPMRPSFHGTGGALLGIQLVNLLFALVTFGIYGFWGRTRVRRYLWSQTEFAGDRFAYHGTGGELLRGYMVGMLLFAGLYVLFAILSLIPVSGASTAFAILLIIVIAFASLVGIARVGARRYRLSRTSWRGIRFSFRGSIREFLGIHVPGVLLTIATLGVYFPFYQCGVRRFFATHTRFGTGHFAFYGEGRDLVGRYLLALVLTIPTLGLYWYWYHAFRDRYYWRNTYFEEAQFRSTVTGGALLGLVVTNMLLVMVTFGLAAPWAIVRARRFVAEKIVLEGRLDLGAILQDPQQAAAAGEGVSELLDLGDVDIGAGF